ncbi:unnamed protein product [Schistosoma rodhaini]|uniref:PSI domain-containing protein n=1 Tax=Schistosoma rodhaini TaxID=6188 RepID=A0AA85ET04_9TREM|nr:unnamed protein product [Schistosoma rodhaini]
MLNTLHFNILMIWFYLMNLLYFNHSTIKIFNTDINETFSQIDHYYYSEFVQFNQSIPIIFDDIIKPNHLSKPWTFKTLFPLLYFGNRYHLVTIFPQGVLGIGPETEKPDSGNIIQVFDGEDGYNEVQRKDSNEFIAIKWVRLNERNSNEYQINDDDCMEYKFCEDCTKEYTSGRKCHWCPKFNKCRHFRDIDMETLLGKDCAIQQIGICSSATDRMVKHIATEEPTVKHSDETINFITLTSDMVTVESDTTENMTTSQVLINTDELNKTNEPSTNDHQTTNMITKFTEDIPITSKHLLLSREILQMYSITFINDVSIRLCIRLLMPFIILIFISSTVFLVWIIRIRRRNNMKN